MVIFFKFLLGIFILYILPTILSIIFAIIAWKLDYKIKYPEREGNKVSLETIYEWYSRDFTDKDGDSNLSLALFSPVINIFFMFYFFTLMIYNKLKTIKV